MSEEIINTKWKQLKKKSEQFKSFTKNLIYPARFDTALVFVVAELAIHFGRNDQGIVDSMASIYIWQLALCVRTALTHWIILAIILKMLLKTLLQYQGYMYEERGAKVTLKTKQWAAMLKGFITYNPPQLYSFQYLLPRQPVPPLKDTVQRYLRSMRPTVDDEAFEQIKKEADEFESGIGKELQRKLIWRSWWTPNYVTDLWEYYAYLRDLNPLMAKSSIYFTDHCAHPTKKQTARAANTTHLFIEYRDKIDKQELPPVMGRRLVPLCSMQFKRLFNTTRIPGLFGDELVCYESSDHIAVLHKGCWYKVKVHYNGRILKPLEIQYQLDQIVNSNPISSHSEKKLAALTSWERHRWADTRTRYFSDGINKKSLDVIESAAFVVVLDDVPYESDFINLTNPENIHRLGKRAMCGNVNDIWFDKSFSVNYGTNAKATINVEHTGTDAMIISRMFEETMTQDIHSYDSEGNIKTNMEFEYRIEPTRLEWDLTEDNLISRIDRAYKEGMELCNDIDFQIIVFTEFGKGFIKSCKLSPDAFCQMAFQLAYFRDSGKFSISHEATMTRFFLHGRTETVRTCSIESAAWVRAMEDPKSSTEERARLLKAACERHQQAYIEAMVGKGIDRHLFSLCVAAKNLDVKSPFLEGFSKGIWGITSSQVPHGQSQRVLDELKKNPELQGTGGFGRSSENGYCITYINSCEDRITLTLSSYISTEDTNTDRFGKRIKQALIDMKGLMDKFKTESGKL